MGIVEMENFFIKVFGLITLITAVVDGKAVVELVDYECSCKNITSRQGVGDCLKPAAGGPYKGKNICYVNKPSSCEDVRKGTLDDEDYSALACVLRDLEPNHFLITENTDCWPETDQEQGVGRTLENCSAVCKNWGNFVHTTSGGTCKCVSALASCSKSMGMNLYQASPDACSTDDDCSNGGSCYAYIGAAYAMCYKFPE